MTLKYRDRAPLITNDILVEMAALSQNVTSISVDDLMEDLFTFRFVSFKRKWKPPTLLGCLL